MVVVYLCALAAYRGFGQVAAESVLWGGLAAIANVALLAWRMMRGDASQSDAHKQLLLMYRSGIERFFVVMMLLAAGMKLMGMVPPAVVAGFVIGQLTHVIARLALNRIET